MNKGGNPNGLIIESAEQPCDNIADEFVDKAAAVLQINWDEARGYFWIQMSTGEKMPDGSNKTISAHFEKSILQNMADRLTNFLLPRFENSGVIDTNYKAPAKATP